MSVNESDKDPHGDDGEYCSDFCRVETSKAKNKDTVLYLYWLTSRTLCIQCKAFPRVNQSFFVEKSGVAIKKSIINSGTLWCGNMCRDSTPN
ncbi:hypothetical protein RhiirA4_468856 [Rhizophagus irregularis]|uniref:Uncharacterized protein n=1 Tax=Rhizophagus irregularis TaxID=588596 RepID=A0A2I1GYH9_9GLOM|nr:hypothetical protein RhiirA4_468856 [Rhizophagus irregularis]